MWKPAPIFLERTTHRRAVMETSMITDDQSHCRGTGQCWLGKSNKRKERTSHRAARYVEVDDPLERSMKSTSVTEVVEGDVEEEEDALEGNEEAEERGNDSSAPSCLQKLQGRYVSVLFQGSSREAEGIRREGNEDEPQLPALPAKFGQGFR